MFLFKNTLIYIVAALILTHSEYSPITCSSYAYCRLADIRQYVSTLLGTNLNSEIANIVVLNRMKRTFVYGRRAESKKVKCCLV